MLDYHNNIRKQCSSANKELTWNSDLASYAQAYADKLANQNSCTLDHTYQGHDSYKEKNAGENLAMYGSTGSLDQTTIAKNAINGWAGEGYGSGSKGGETGHYTAMNWEGTGQVGCGFGTNTNKNCVVTSCNYSNSEPNVMGQYDQNVKCTNPLKLTI